MATAKKKKHSTPVRRTLDPATPADVAMAEGLIPSTNQPIGAPLGNTAVTALSNPKLQTKILGVAPQLAVFDGCDDLQAIFDAANEAQQLLGVYERLINSAGRVRQRYVQLGGRVTVGQTALVNAKDSAAPTSAVAKTLSGLAGLRAAEVSKAKGKGTITKNAKKAAAQDTGTAKKG
jgi:hypothetical protein